LFGLLSQEVVIGWAHIIHSENMSTKIMEDIIWGHYNNNNNNNNNNN
jgi:hypothetical protein